MLRNASLALLLLPLPADPEWQVREKAVAMLGMLEDPQFTPHLLPLLVDPHRGVRKTVMRSLKGCGFTSFFAGADG